MTDYPKPLVAVDIAAFTVLDADLKLLLVARRDPPLGLALPGGFVRCGDALQNQGEDLPDAARRELLEETRLPLADQGRQIPLVQVGVFGAPDRDPRARVVTVAYLAVVRPELAAFVRAGGDASAVAWHPVSEVTALPLLFDHASIAQRALERLRSDVLTSGLARSLVPEPFTVPELRAAVDAVSGVSSDAGNFRRRFLRLQEDGRVRPAVGKRVSARRPAQVWTFA